MNVPQLRVLQKKGDVQALKNFFINTEKVLTEEMCHIICIACIDNSQKCGISFYKRFYDYSLRFTSEQMITLLIRISLIYNTQKVKYLLERSLNLNILKKRSIVYIIDNLVKLDDDNLDLALYCYHLSKKFVLDCLHYSKLIHYFKLFNKNEIIDDIYISIIQHVKIITLDMAELLLQDNRLNTTIVSIHKKGYCSHCNKTLYNPKISDRDKKVLLNAIKKNSNSIEFESFINTYIDSRPNIDYVLDGANIGYYNQRPDKGNELSYSNIDKIVQHLLSKGKRLLIFLHERHFKNNSYIIKWIRMNILFKTPRGHNDDWFWLYYSIYYNNCKVITNDLLTDHYYQCLHSDAFRVWRKLTCVQFQITDRKLKLIEPPNYINELYKNHIPFKTSHNIQWLCITHSYCSMK